VKNEQNKIYSEITLIFNRNLNVSAQRLDSITKALPGVKQTILDLPTDISVNLEQKYDQAKKVLTAFMQKNIGDEPVYFLIASPFFVDFPAVFPDGEDVRKYSIVYDFTPYKIWHLQRIFPDDIYARHFGVLLEADGLLTISQAVKDDLVNLFGLEPGTITNINGGPFEQSEASSAEVALKKPYILYPSAPIVHKNNERAVKAFSAFNAEHNDRYTLYFTSTFEEKYRSELMKKSENIEFTGNLTDIELVKAYKEASAIFFPSLAEGLGMPVLEGVLYDIPIACSDIPVLSELSKELYLFDPTDISDMARKLSQAVEKENWARRQIAYSKLKSDYTWANSADSLIRALGGESQNNSIDAGFKFPDSSQNNPAARLAELLFGRIRKEFKGELQMTSSGGKPESPTFAKYLTRAGTTPTDKLITFSEKRTLLPRTPKRVELKVELEGRTISSLTLYARPYLYDKALGLRCWQYKDSQNQVLSPKQIYNRIVKMVGEV
jgi:glycosyltransferase involved in cell wall biosynthesis